jgi:GntR family transcriptional repressor for pyruvate dehydrogenase complex
MNSEDTTHIPIKPIQKRSIPEEILHQLRTLIESGRIKPGSRLPGEREMAQKLDVSRPSLREALRALSLLGIIENRPGSGTYLATPSDKWPLEPFRILLTIHKGTLIDIFEARKSLEGTVAALAAHRRSNEDLHIMSGALERMAANLKNNDAYGRHELAFHRAIVEASRNIVIAELMDKLYGLLQETRDRIYTHGSHAQSRRNQDYHNHVEIFNLIRDGNAEGATKAMINHLIDFEKNLMAEYGGDS